MRWRQRAGDAREPKARRRDCQVGPRHTGIAKEDSARRRRPKASILAYFSNLLAYFSNGERFATHEIASASTPIQVMAACMPMPWAMAPIAGGPIRLPE